jgi:hypothetical protein
VAEVTYCVGLPSVASDDGVAAGEPTESFSPVAVVMGAKALSRNQGHVGVVALEATEKLGAAAPENLGAWRARVGFGVSPASATGSHSVGTPAREKIANALKSQ